MTSLSTHLMWKHVNMCVFSAYSAVLSLTNHLEIVSIETRYENYPPFFIPVKSVFCLRGFHSEGNLGGIPLNCSTETVSDKSCYEIYIDFKCIALTSMETKG